MSTIETPGSLGASAGGLPLSFNQLIWYRPEAPELIPPELQRSPVIYEVQGELSVDALRGALAELLRRHGILRTRYHWDGKRKWQEVIDATAPQLEVTDLRQSTPASQRGGIGERLSQLYAAPPDHTQGSPLLAELYVLAPQLHCLALIVDHIVLDNHAMRIMLEELFEHYDAIIEGGSPAQKKAEVQYTDYALATQKFTAPEVLEANRTSWMEMIGDTTPLCLHTDRSVSFTSSKPQRMVIPVHEEAKNSAADLASELGLPITVVIHAALTSLLSHWTGQRSILVGCIADQRPAKMRGVIGTFVRTSPLFVDFRETSTVRDALEATRKGYLKTIDPKRMILASDLPGLAQVTLNYQRRDAQAMSPGVGSAPRSPQPARPAPFSPAQRLTAQSAPPPAREELGLSRHLHLTPWRPDQPLNSRVHLDFQAFLFERPDQMYGHVVYAADRVDSERVRWFCLSIQRLLSAMAKRPDDNIWSLIAALDRAPPQRIGALT